MPNTEAKAPYTKKTLYIESTPVNIASVPSAILSSTHKLLFSLIYGLSKLENGCTASNDTIGKSLGFSHTYISSSIKELTDFGLLKPTEGPSKSRDRHLHVADWYTEEADVATHLLTCPAVVRGIQNKEKRGRKPTRKSAAHTSTDVSLPADKSVNRVMEDTSTENNGASIETYHTPIETEHTSIDVTNLINLNEAEGENERLIRNPNLAHTPIEKEGLATADAFAALPSEGAFNDTVVSDVDLFPAGTCSGQLDAATQVSGNDGAQAAEGHTAAAISPTPLPPAPVAAVVGTAVGNIAVQEVAAVTPPVASAPVMQEVVPQAAIGQVFTAFYESGKQGHWQEYADASLRRPAEIRDVTKTKTEMGSRFLSALFGPYSTGYAQLCPTKNGVTDVANDNLFDITQDGWQKRLMLRAIGFECDGWDCNIGVLPRNSGTHALIEVLKAAFLWADCDISKKSVAYYLNLSLQPAEIIVEAGDSLQLYWHCYYPNLKRDTEASKLLKYQQAVCHSAEVNDFSHCLPLPGTTKYGTKNNPQCVLLKKYPKVTETPHNVAAGGIPATVA